MKLNVPMKWSGPFLILLGIGLAFWGGDAVRKGQASAQWPTLEGQITRSDMRKAFYSTDDKGGEYYRYNVFIEYEYEVDGSTYTNDRVRFDAHSYYRPGEARSLTLRYAVGDRKPVHYDPQDPGNSVLESGATFTAWATAVGGAAMALAGLVTMVWLLFFKPAGAMALESQAGE